MQVNCVSKKEYKPGILRCKSTQLCMNQQVNTVGTDLDGEVPGVC